MITVDVTGNFDNTERLIKKARTGEWQKALDPYVQKGVDALRIATPTRSGLTASSWYGEVHKTKNGCEIVWSNSNNNRGANVAILLQYGHGTGTGGYVQGIDYINPALRPVFQELADNAWKELVGR